MLKHIKEYYIESFVKEKYKDKIQDYFRSKEIWEGIEPLKDSQNYLEKLHNLGHEIYIVTATHSDGFSSKCKWIKRNYPFIKTDNIIRCVNKSLLDLEILIDDYQENFKGARYIGILLDYAWNRDCKYFNVKRAFDWKDIYNKVCEIYSNELTKELDERLYYR